VFSAQIFQENTFLETKPNFSLTGKCFSNGKQIQKSLKNNFLKSKFQKTNIALNAERIVIKQMIKHHYLKA
jgi:hypothetical protein